MTPNATPTPREILRETFGFETFLDGQLEVIEKLLGGRSVVAIFPTGGGKSLCYQLPALLLDHLTLVVSPLIALMKDQIDALAKRGVAAARIDSSQTPEEARAVREALRAGTLKILYVSPERLANERFRAFLGSRRIDLLAVDEAHCLSEWGHNFRPDYLKLGALSRELGAERVLALTATATPETATDIRAAFGIAPEDEVRLSHYRPNLVYRASLCTAAERDELLVRKLTNRDPGATLVYVTLQRTTETVAERLRAEGFDARAYHAGMDAEARHAVQDWFLSSADGVVAATIAFGMGIDKPDIRYVYHYNLPKSLENYAQETGRSGRDGLESVCQMLACAEDTVVLENFVFGDTPDRDALAEALSLALGDGTPGETVELSPIKLAHACDLRPLVASTLLAYLELDGALEYIGAGYAGFRFKPLRPSKEILARFDADRAAFLRAVLACAQKKRTWFHLNVEQAARAASAPRERVVAALDYLAEQGDLELQPSDPFRRYRVLPRQSTPEALLDMLTERFHTRETRDIARIATVVEYAESAHCRTHALVAYFGEDLGRPCGHCDTCLGATPGLLPARADGGIPPGTAEVAAGIAREHPRVFPSARRMTRFFCGLSTPRVQRAGLTRHPAFGSLARIPFAEVCAFLEAGSPLR